MFRTAIYCIHFITGKLLFNFKLPLSDVGRLEVGSESHNCVGITRWDSGLLFINEAQKRKRHVIKNTSL